MMQWAPCPDQVICLLLHSWGIDSTEYEFISDLMPMGKRFSWKPETGLKYDLGERSEYTDLLILNHPQNQPALRESREKIISNHGRKWQSVPCTCTSTLARPELGVPPVAYLPPPQGRWSCHFAKFFFFEPNTFQLIIPRYIKARYSWRCRVHGQGRYIYWSNTILWIDSSQSTTGLVR